MRTDINILPTPTFYGKCMSLVGFRITLILAFADISIKSNTFDFVCVCVFCIISLLQIDHGLSWKLSVGSNRLLWCRHICLIILDTGRGIGPETCRLDNVFSPEDLWLGSDTEHEMRCYM